MSRSSTRARSPVIRRTSSSAVIASRSASARSSASFTVRTEWPSTNPASHNGYHSRPASSAGERDGGRRRRAAASRRCRIRGTARVARTTRARPAPTAPTPGARQRPRAAPRRRVPPAHARTPRRVSHDRRPTPPARRAGSRGVALPDRATPRRGRPLPSGSATRCRRAGPTPCRRRSGRCAASMRRSTTRSASASSTRISTRTFGTKSTVYSAPRYTSVCPRWRPKPCTSETVSPWTPRSLTASFTSSSLNGLMIPTISFICDSHHGARHPGRPLVVRPGRASTRLRSAA